MTVTDEQGNLICRIYWVHKKSREHLSPGDSTVCVIDSGKDTPYYCAVATCSLSEPVFDRNKGRKLSLARVLRYFPYRGNHKDFRKKVWEAYHKMRGSKW